MLDLEKIPESVIKDLRSFYHDDEIQLLSSAEAFDAFLEYRGFAGYAEEVIYAYEKLKAAEI